MTKFSEILKKNFQAKSSYFTNQKQTKNVFTEKWKKFSSNKDSSKLYDFQKKWFLKLYGFKSEKNLKNYLQKSKFILDTGCGLGYKSAWFANLAPNSVVIGIDISDSIDIAKKKYNKLNNLYFLKGDIASLPFKSGSIDFVCCDQVIMHTENPDKTFKELSRVTRDKGQLLCYFYKKKALPRELLDDYFREYCKNLTNKEIWDLSKGLTLLGRELSKIKKKINVPEIKQLGIKSGKIDIQRFVYWNFVKCYWNENLGYQTSLATNFDWYSPSNARRFTKKEVKILIEKNRLKSKSFYEEEACYSIRVSK